MEQKKLPEYQYSIRKNGRIYAQSAETNCGYSRDTLQGMTNAGYRLYRDGKPVRKGG